MQARQGQQQAREATTALVQGHGLVRFAIENSPDQTAEHGLGPDLDEHPSTGCMHGLDLGDELHRLDQVLGHGLLDQRWLGGMQGGTGVGVDRQTPGLPARGLDGGGEQALGRSDEGRMEGGGYRNRAGIDAALLQHLQCLGDAGAGAADNALLRGVVVGDQQLRNGGDGLFDLSTRCLDHGHAAQLAAGAGGSLDDKSATSLGQAHQSREVDLPGSEQGDELAVAVAGKHIAGHTQFTQQAQQAGLYCTEGRLGHVGAGQRRTRRLTGGFVIAGARMDELAQRLAGETLGAGGQQAVGLGQGVGNHREQHGQLAQHIDVLRTLAGEQQGHLARLDAAVAEHDGRIDQHLAGQPLLGLGQLVCQFVEAADHQRQAVFTLAEVVAQVTGDIAQRHLARRRQLRLQLGHLALQLLAAAGTPQQQLGAPGIADALDQPGAVLAGILLEHRMEVGTAETEGTDGGAARLLCCGQPGLCLVEHAERAVVLLQHGVGRLHAQVRRQHLVV